MENGVRAFPTPFSRLRWRSDEQLVARAARGDTAALAAFYDRYAHVAYGLALRVLRDPRRAEAVVEDAFVALARMNGEVASSTAAMSVRAWFLTRIHRSAVDVLRSTPEASRPQPTSGARANDRVSRRSASQREQTERALAQLSHEQRETLELAYYEGYSVDELARRLRKSPATIKETLSTALRQLRDALAQEEAPTRALADARKRARGTDSRRPSRAALGSHARNYRRTTG